MLIGEGLALLIELDDLGVDKRDFALVSLLGGRCQCMASIGGLNLQ